MGVVGFNKVLNIIPANAEIGSIHYVKKDGVVRQYLIQNDGTPIEVNGNTLETIIIPDGNQTINVSDAKSIVGFTLISSQASLSAATGKMSGTWMINEDRGKIRCFIQTLEDPYIKFLVCTCQIDNDNNTFTISQKTARYWTITGALPQSTMSNTVTNYRLEKLVLIRK